jgi:serine/threonine protein kinase
MTQDDQLSPPYVPGYDLLEPLGRGATSVVWRARPDSCIDPRAGSAQVAIKIVTAGPDAERELAVLSGVRHPHLLELHEVVALGAERLAVVTDLLEGGTLASVVAARGRLRPGEVVTVLVPLAQALGALHATGVLHGDLAPGNVLFTLDGRPALTDLGTTRITGEPRDEVYGTAGYVDPVVLTGGDPTAASDVYGLGALGWLALTGSPPPSPVHRPPLRELAPSAPQALVAAIEAAVDITLKYTKERTAFGKPVFEFQNTKFKLAEAATTAKIARVFIDDCIAKHINGELDIPTASMAKWWTTQAQCDVADECLQFFGGYGYMQEYPISKMFTDSRIQKIYGGTNEIMKEIISRFL